MEKNASIHSKNFHLWETELSEVDKLYTFCRLHWSFTAALWFQYWVTFSRTSEKFLSLKKDKKLFPWSPESPSPPTTLKISLPIDPMERRALEGEYSVFTSFLYTLIFRSKAFKRLEADWLREEMTLTLLKKKNKKQQQKSPAVQALQPLAELQIPQIFTKPFIPLMAYLITVLSHSC